MSCVDSDCTTFTTGNNSVGTYEINAHLCGERVVSHVEVTPATEGCGVETQWVGLHVDAGLCSSAQLDYDGETPLNVQP